MTLSARKVDGTLGIATLELLNNLVQYANAPLPGFLGGLNQGVHLGLLLELHSLSKSLVLLVKANGVLP